MQASPVPAAATRVHVARQPIFDPSLRVVAYELLYRREGATSAQICDRSLATAEVVAAATLDIGLSQLVGEHPAFVNFPAELLCAPLHFPMDPARIVIELLEGSQPEAALLTGLERLRAAGFRIALDDYDPRVHSPVFLDFADIVKLDVQEHAPGELAASVRGLRSRDLQLVAEKVETAAELRHCLDLGVDYVQGYFLQKPEVFASQRPPSSRLAALQTIIALSDQEVSVVDLEASVARDVGLSYRILRCINSSYYHLPREVSSLRQAITLLGFEELRRICVLLMLAEMDDRPAYVSIQALARARMCESLCAMSGMVGRDAFFMVGFLSTLDVLLGQPLAEALRSLPLSDSIRTALLSESGPLGAAVACAKHYERGEWGKARFSTLTEEQIDQAYSQAVGWADAAWKSVFAVDRGD